MDIENWAKSSTVSDEGYWERAFPGYGAKIVALTSRFQGWVPVLGEANFPLIERDELQVLIKTATAWMNVQEVQIFDLSHAQKGQRIKGQRMVKFGINTACTQKFRSDEALVHRVKDAVGNAFGPVITTRSIPSQMLRAWLYQLLVDAIVRILMDDNEIIVQLQTILELWRQGCYLIGFRVEEGKSSVAIVIIGRE
jgi:hypothetical protein